MRKLYFRNIIIVAFLILLLNVTSVMAQQLRLPDEVIVGNVTVTPDSLDVNKDFSEFYKVHNLDRFIYRPVLDKKLDFDKSRSNQNAYVYLSLNSRYHADLRVGLHSIETPEINLYARTSYEKLDDDFSALKMQADWKPMTYYSDFKIRPAFFFKKSNNESNFDINESDFQSFELSVAATPNDFQPLNRVRLSIDFSMYEHSNQVTNKDYKKNRISSDLNVNFDNFLFIEESDFNTYYKFGNVHYESNFYLNTFLNSFALNLQLSKNFTPSILFEKSIYLTEFSEFSILNLPYLSKKSLSDYHDFFAFADINDIKYAEQVPLNLYLAYSLYNPLELQLSLNSSYHKNLYCMFYDGINAYYWISDNALRNSVNLDVKKNYYDFTFGLNSSYLLSNLTNIDIKIPWEAHFKNSLSAGYRYKALSLELIGTTYMQRYDSFENKISDVFILSSSNSIDISRNFKMSLNFYNILNQKFYHVKGLPNNEFNAELSVRVLF